MSPSSASDTQGPGTRLNDDDDITTDLVSNLGIDGQYTSHDQHAGFFGGPSGFAFLHKTKHLFDGDGAGGSNVLEVTHEEAIKSLFDAPFPDKQALASSSVPLSLLVPSQATAYELVDVVFNHVYPLLYHLDTEDFRKRVKRMYEVDPIDFDDDDHEFVPLFYAVLSLGFLFSQKQHHRYGCNRALSQA